MWPLTVGDEWEYAVTMELPRDAEFKEDDSVTVKETTEGVEVRYKEVQRYLGKTAPKKGMAPLETFAVLRGGELQSTEFMQVTGDGIYGRASMSADGGKGAEGKKKVMLLAKPLLLVSAGAKAGDVWKVAAKPDEKGTVAFKRDFRCFGKVSVKVPAGEFAGTKMEVSGVNGAVELRREYWFVPGTGFVKEVKTYYSKKKRLVCQTHELLKLTKGSGKTEEE